MSCKADRNEPLQEQEVPLFSDYAEKWLDDAKGRLKGAKTPEYHISKHLAPAFGKKSLDTITTDDVNKWQTKRLKKAKPATVKRERDTLKAIFGSATKGSHPILKINPCVDANKITGITGRFRALSEEEILKLLASANKIEKWLDDTILWYLHSGMRRSELLNLKWSDVIILKDGRVYAQVKKAKNDEYRAIQCTETMKKILKRFKKLRTTKPAYVFPYSLMTLRRRWEEAKEKAGLKDQITMHDLRTTNITYAVTSGADLRTVAARSGHSNLAMIEKHYAALRDSSMMETANRIEKMFGGMVSRVPRKDKK